MAGLILNLLFLLLTLYRPLVAKYMSLVTVFIYGIALMLISLIKSLISALDFGIFDTVWASLRAGHWQRCMDVGLVLILHSGHSALSSTLKSSIRNRRILILVKPFWFTKYSSSWKLDLKRRYRILIALFNHAPHAFCLILLCLLVYIGGARR